jgi:long-chain acyl-CoA synthetase
VLHRILAQATQRHPDKAALVTASRTLTYRELDELSDAVAAALTGGGVRTGDRVSLYSANCWEWVVAYHGIAKAGAVANPINVMLTAEEVAFVVNDCGARVMLTSADKAPAVAAAAAAAPGLERVVVFGAAPDGCEPFDDLLTTNTRPPTPNIDPTALATIAYTSGTTGHPKGAMQSQRAVHLNCALTATMHVRTPADVVVTALPAPHVYGNVVINGKFLAGGTVVLMERFDPAAALGLVEEHHATMFEGVPTMYAMLLAQPDLRERSLSSLTRCTVGGQTISTAVMASWEECSGAPLLELWGMTELAGLGTTHALYAANVHGSIGVALPGTEVRVAHFDDAAVTMPAGEAGELMVRGPIVMLGYYGNDDATKTTIEADGWMHTGDVATADESGHYYIVDRRKDMLITAGYNVYPAEIERVIATHPAVAMVAVGAQRDELRGELARAYVVLKPDASVTDEELIAHCRQHLAAYKVPRSVAFVPDLPKTSTGKIMRRELHTLDG